MIKTKDLTPERLKARLGDIHCTGPVNGTAASIVGQALRRIEALERENARLRAAYDQAKTDRDMQMVTAVNAYKEIFDAALDAASTYTKEQYGMAFLDHPIDRDRIREIAFERETA